MFTRQFREITKNDVDIAGGKGASLGEMTQAGIPVPSGYVILAKAFDYFIKENHLIAEIDAILEKVNHKEMESIEDASEEIRALILDANLPIDIKTEVRNQFKELDSEFVAVRSSATSEDSSTAAWAGQLETYLNTTEKSLLTNIKKCWASLFTPRAIFYRFEKNLHKSKISVAVVIQKMVQSDVSGIAFSVHPVTQDRNQMIIEAGYGLGEAIVSGQITPDSYVIEKDHMRILDKSVVKQARELIKGGNGATQWMEINEDRQGKQKLNDKEVLRLARLIAKIEKHYGFPCDIEWVLEKDKFYITQSRPITTLGNAKGQAKSFSKDDYILALWFQGVSVFVTDIHNDLYKRLEALFIIDNGIFKQYFTKRAHERALEDGVKFYGDKCAFDAYKKDLTGHCDRFRRFFDTRIKEKKQLSEDTVRTFFDYTRKLCGDYTKMNFEFTDKAFTLQDGNSTIKNNLSKVGAFKEKIRNFMNMVLFEPTGYSYELFAILAKQFKLSPQIFDNLTQKEILALFEGKRPDQQRTSKRQHAFVESYNLDGFYEGREAESILQEFEERVSKSDSIKGQVASKGKATGRVKIIPVDYGDIKKLNAEIAKMKQGDILVAETTAPELMVACKKAGAIITDAGGLMSHAAIVSRELGIPCIVGTQNATKMLNNGDEVEVNADKGVINILKRNNKGRQ